MCLLFLQDLPYTLFLYFILIVISAYLQIDRPLPMSLKLLRSPSSFTINHLTSCVSYPTSLKTKVNGTLLTDVINFAFTQSRICIISFDSSSFRGSERKEREKKRNRQYMYTSAHCAVSIYILAAYQTSQQVSRSCLFISSLELKDCELRRSNTLATSC